jgi:SAM-dependent methyltransferase
MARLRKPGMADEADRHHLYQESVQDTEAEIDFVEETWAELRFRPPELLREDFCGTANTSCEWIRRDAQHYAVGVDLDPEVLAWGRVNNVGKLAPEQRGRITLLQENVLNVSHPLADIVLAMNFSYYLFMEREFLLDYFRGVYSSLVEDGIFFLDAYGGYDAPKELEERRDCEGFTYVWDQALPEVRELLFEAGFSEVDIYWEGTDEETNEGNGIYTPAEVGDADTGWVCYIVAQR